MQFVQLGINEFPTFHNSSDDNCQTAKANKIFVLA